MIRKTVLRDALTRKPIKMNAVPISIYIEVVAQNAPSRLHYDGFSEETIKDLTTVKID
jgi:hypothetical protein